MRRVFALACLTILLPSSTIAQRFEVPASSGSRWFKGNTHSHTLNTDGDSPPDTVIRWYRSHGYNFLVISDHDTITDPASYRQYIDSGFMLVPGEEVTGRFQGSPVHLTAINLQRIVKPRTDATLLGTLQANVDAIRQAGGVPLINHPNYRWALNRETLGQTNGVALFELFNGHPHVHNLGGGTAPSLEAVWDALLSAGKRMYGVASDDSHFWKKYDQESPNPGRGWVYVRAAQLTPGAIAVALSTGQFYSSTGPELVDLIVTPTTIEVRIKQDRDFRYRTEFIGDNGRVLSQSTELISRHELAPGVTYVRARITDSGGRVAWTQPVFVAK